VGISAALRSQMIYEMPKVLEIKNCKGDLVETLPFGNTMA
jgi:hypothetical protein